MPISFTVVVVWLLGYIATKSHAGALGITFAYAIMVVIEDPLIDFLLRRQDKHEASSNIKNVHNKSSNFH